MAARDVTLILLAKATEAQKVQCEIIADALGVEPVGEVRHWPDNLYRQMQEAQELAAFLERVAVHLTASTPLTPTTPGAQSSDEPPGETSNEVLVEPAPEKPTPKPKASKAKDKPKAPAQEKE